MEIAFQDLVLKYYLVVWGGDDVEDHRLLVAMTESGVSVLLGNHTQGIFPHTSVDRRICSPEASL